MEQRNQVNPDQVIQQTLQSRLNVYAAKESFESVLKTYNDNMESLTGVINLMKARILQLESDAGQQKAMKGIEEKEIEHV